MTVEVIIDTNFFLIPGQFKVDIFSEIFRVIHTEVKLCVLEGTTEELEKLVATEKGKDKECAKLGLALLKAKDIYIITTPLQRSDVDSAIVEYVKKRLSEGIPARDLTVATQDIGLRRRLKPLGIPLLSLRQKSHLEYINYV